MSWGETCPTLSPLVSTALRRLALPLAILSVGLPVGIGAVMAMRPSEAPQEASESGRWEQVRTFTGVGAAERSFAIAEGAIQWKAEWTCSSGNFRMSVGRDSSDDKLVADTSCPDAGTETSTGEGSGRLQVSASGPWRVVISQQVDTALEEPPLPGMTKASLLARGSFHPIQRNGEGRVSLHRLPNGRLALRYEDFYTSPSPGPELWLSRATNPQSTLDAREAPYTIAGTPRSTFGSYNQLLPRGVRAEELGSIVVWCPAVSIAFSAAPLSTP